MDDTLRLDDAQVREYHENGFLTFPALFSPSEVDDLLGAFDRDCERPGPHRVMEDDGLGVRALYASHLRGPEFGSLVRSRRLLSPARQLMPADLHVYQFKINSKPAFVGEGLAWHQDYTAWKLLDDLPAPRQVNIGFFLDEVTEFNGPLIVVPGSHRSGSVRKERNLVAKSTQHLDPEGPHRPALSDPLTVLAEGYPPL
jgi:ectoine hydroxylase